MNWEGDVFDESEALESNVFDSGLDGLYPADADRPGGTLLSITDLPSPNVKNALAVLALTVLLTSTAIAGDNKDICKTTAYQTTPPVQTVSMYTNVAVEFERHMSEWKRATALTSSGDTMSSHPSYRAIIALGPQVLPSILRELEKNPDHWFRALKEISGADPVPPAARGRLKLMTAAWIEWGKKRGYQW